MAKKNKINKIKINEDVDVMEARRLQYAFGLILLAKISPATKNIPSTSQQDPSHAL